MAHGIQVFNPDGSLQFDTSNRIFRVLATLSAGTSNGSASIPGSDTGSVLLMVTPSGEGEAPPSVSVTGSTVTWTHTAPVGQRAGADLTVLAY